MTDGAIRPGSVGLDSSRAPEAQRSQSSTLPGPQTITDGSAPSDFDPTLEYSTEHVVLFWQPPSCFSQWSPSSFVVDDVSYPCAEQFIMAERPVFSRTTAPRSPLRLRQTRVRTSALVEACVISTTPFGAAFEKTPSLLALLPSSHGIRP